MANTLNAKQVKEQKRRTRRRLLESAGHWKRVLATESGRYILLELMNEFSTFRTLPTQPDVLQRSAGWQSAGHYILERVAEISPELLGGMLSAPYIQRMKEKLERERQEEAERQKKNPPDSGDTNTADTPEDE